MSCEVTVLAKVAGATYYLNNVDGWMLMTYDGLGIPNIRRLSQRGPFQDGDTDLGFRRDPRYISLTWIQKGCTPKDLYNLKTQIQGIFRPRIDDPVELQFQFPNSTRRSSIVNLQGVFDHLTADRLDGNHWRVSGVFKASDPRLFDPDQVIIDTASDTDGWTVEESGASEPWTSDTGWDVSETSELLASGWNIGLSNLVSSVFIYYANGEINADFEFPVITIHGPITDPSIINLTTNERLIFSGLTIPLGGYVTIDLRYGFKTIIDNNGNDVSEYLTSNNALSTWHLAYPSELLTNGQRVGADGLNRISMTGSSITSATRIVMEYYNRYIGA